MITDLLLNIFGCPPLIVLMLASFICPFLPLIVLALIRKSINVPKGSSAADVLGYILIILYVVYACYAFMVPQALIGQCGYANY